VFPTLAGTGLGLLAHAVWFFACEALLPRSAAPVPVAPPRPAAGPAISPAAPAPPAPSKDFRAVPVLAVIDESPTIRTFRLARPADFEFKAGQFLTVRVAVDGKPHVRCYSISSAPEARGYVEISVKRQGLVSGTLHATVRPGSQLMVRPPAGKFVYPADDDRPIALVAAGVGITPLVSMLRHAVASDPSRLVTVIYSARGEEELAFWDELRWLARRHPHLRIVPTLTGPAPSWSGRLGRIDGTLLREQVTDLAHVLFMICGPADMIQGVRQFLEEAGVPKGQVRSEVFQASTAIGAAAPAADLAQAPDLRPDARPTLSLVRSRKTVTVERQQTLLEAAEAAGGSIPSLCRAGVCRTCRTRLTSGEARCSSDALDEAERAEGWTLPCVAWPKSDCSLDA
jgi:ferredoxin-NADP reductase